MIAGAAWRRKGAVALLCTVLSASASAQTLPDVTSSDGRDTGGLSIDVFAAAYRGVGANESALIGAEIRGLRPGNAEAASGPRRLHVVYSVAAGDTPIADHTISVPLDSVSPPITPDGIVRVLSRLDLPPGQFQVLVTVRDSQDGRMGWAVHPLVVDPFAAQADPIAVSGVMVTSSSVTGFTHADPNEEYRLQPILAQPPSARRQFSTSEKVEVLMEVYEVQSDPDLGGGMTVYTRVVDANGKVVFDTSDIGTSEAFTDGRWGYQHWQLVPVRQLTPGRYELQVGASSGDSSWSAWRSIPITIIPDAAP